MVYSEVFGKLEFIILGTTRSIMNILGALGEHFVLVNIFLLKTFKNKDRPCP